MKKAKNETAEIFATKTNETRTTPNIFRLRFVDNLTLFTSLLMFTTSSQALLLLMQRRFSLVNVSVPAGDAKTKKA